MKTKNICNSSSTISFSKVEIFEFPYTIGDSPSVTGGAPLAMEPYHQDKYIFDFEEYDDAKMALHHRTKQQLRMDADLRTRILLTHGHSLAKIFEAEAAAKKARELRQQSANSCATLIALNQARLVTRRKLQSLVGKSTKRRSFSNIDSHEYRYNAK